MEARWNNVWRVFMVYVETPQGLSWTGETTPYVSGLRQRSIRTVGGPADNASQTHNEEHWSRCPFCRAYNGTYYRPLEQHRPRCRWLGNASDFDLMRPNYTAMLAEDSPGLLASIHAQDALRTLRAELQKCVPATVELEKWREEERRKKAARDAAAD